MGEPGRALTALASSPASVSKSRAACRWRIRGKWKGVDEGKRQERVPIRSQTCTAYVGRSVQTPLRACYQSPYGEQTAWPSHDWPLSQTASLFSARRWGSWPDVSTWVVVVADGQDIFKYERFVSHRATKFHRLPGARRLRGGAPSAAREVRTSTTLASTRQRRRVSQTPFHTGRQSPFRGLAWWQRVG